MNLRTKNTLIFSAAAIFAVLLVVLTLNGAVDHWLPQADLKTPAAPSAPAVEPAALQIPPAAQPLPAAPLTEREASASPPVQWNQPLYEPKFEGPGFARTGPQGGSQGFAIPDFGSLNQFAPLSQVLPPSVSTPGSDPAVVSIKPIFNSKSGGVDSGIGGAAGNVSGTVGNTVGGVTSGANSLLKR